MKNYYNEQEENDEKLLHYFNNRVKFFQQINFTPRGTNYDAECIDVSGRTCHIEMKNRYYDYDKINDIYIEPNKFMTMTERSINGKIPLYINFFNNGEYVVIHNLGSPLTIKYIPFVKIHDKGDGREKIVQRFSLPKNEGIIFKKEGDGYVRCR